ncbi:MAG: Calx-beta domain-containing protein [Cyanobacteriota bacterium ELA615]
MPTNIDLSSGQSAIATDAAGKTHVVWFDGNSNIIWQATYNPNSGDYDNAQIVAVVPSTENVSNLQLLTQGNLIRSANGNGFPGLAVVWQESSASGSGTNSNLYYTAAKYDSNGQLQWLSNPVDITGNSSSLANQAPTALVDKNSNIHIVSQVVNPTNAANQSIREASELYSQTLTINNSDFSTNNTIDPPTEPYSNDTLAQPVSNYTPDTTNSNGGVRGLQPIGAPSTSTGLQGSQSSGFSGAGIGFFAQLQFKTNLIKDWGIYAGLPELAVNSLDRTGLDKLLNNYEIRGTIQGGYSLGGSFGSSSAAGPYLSASARVDFILNQRKYEAIGTPLFGDKNKRLFDGAKSTNFISLGFDSKYKYNNSFDLSSITNKITLALYNKVKLEIKVEGIQAYLERQTFVGLSYYFIAKPTSNYYNPDVIKPVLFAISGLQGAGLIAAALYLKSLENIGSSQGSADAFGRLILSSIGADFAAVFAAYANGQTTNLDISQAVEIFASSGLAGKLAIGFGGNDEKGKVKFNLEILQIKAETRIGFYFKFSPNFGIDFIISIPISIRTGIGPFTVGVSLNPTWKIPIYTTHSSSLESVAPNSSAQVQGSLLTVNLGNTLNPNNNIDPSQFKVTVTDIQGNITTIGVFDVVVRGNSVILDLDSPIPYSPETTSTQTSQQAIQVTYTPSASDVSRNIQQSDGISIAGFSDPVINNTSQYITYTYQPAAGDSSNYSATYYQLNLNFSTGLNIFATPNISQFIVTSNGTIIAVDSLEVSSTGVSLQLDSKPSSNVTVQYIAGDPNTNNILEDISGVAIASFTINNGISVDNGSSPDSKTIVLSFADSLNAQYTPNISQFEITAIDVDGNRQIANIMVKSVIVAANEVILTVNFANPEADVIVVYNPASGSNNNLQYANGNLLNSFTVSSLVSGSTPQSITTNSNGNNIQENVYQATSPTITLTSNNNILTTWVGDVQPITPIGGLLDGSSVILNFIQALQPGYVPDSSQFKITDQFGKVYLLDANPSILGDNLVLKISGNVPANAIFNISYTLSSVNKKNLALTDATQTVIWLDSFQNFIVANTLTNQTAPVLVNAATVVVHYQDTYVNQITLVFDQKLQQDQVNTSDFTIWVNGIQYKLYTTPIVNADTVILEVPNPTGDGFIGPGDNVTISYSGTELKSAGNGLAVPAFSNHKVTTSATVANNVIKYIVGSPGSSNLADISTGSVPGSDGINSSVTSALDKNGKDVIAWIHNPSPLVPTDLLPGEQYSSQESQLISDSQAQARIYYSTFDDQSKTWSIASPLVDSKNSIGGKDLTVSLGQGPDGNMIAVWLNTDINGTNQIYESTLLSDGANPQWSVPHLINTPTPPDDQSSLSVQNISGQPAIFWTSTQPASYAELVANDQPLIYWRFDGSDGTNLNNLGSLLGTGNGTYDGNVVFNRTGALLNGNINSGDPNPAVFFKNGASATLTGYSYSGESLSIEFWFEIPSSGLAIGSTNLVSIPGLLEVSLNNQAGSKPGLAWQVNGQSEPLTIQEPLNAGQWYYVVVTYDNQANTAELYLNANPIASVNNVNLTPNTSDFTESVNLVAAGTPNSSVYLDELAVYNQALSYSSTANIPPDQMTGEQLLQVSTAESSNNDIGQKYSAQYNSAIPSGSRTNYVVWQPSSDTWSALPDQIKVDSPIVPTKLTYSRSPSSWDLVSDTPANAPGNINPNGNSDLYFNLLLNNDGNRTIIGVSIASQQANETWAIGSAVKNGANELAVMVGNQLLNNLNPKGGNFSYYVGGAQENLELFVDDSAHSNLAKITDANITVYFSDDTTVYKDQQSLNIVQNTTSSSATGIVTVTEANDKSLSLINSGFNINTSNANVAIALATGDFRGLGSAQDAAIVDQGYLTPSEQKVGASIQVLFGNGAILSNKQTSSLNGTDLSGNPDGVLIDGFLDGAAPDALPLSVAIGHISSDKFDDLVIGDPNANNGAGAVYVIYGSYLASNPGQIIDINKLKSNQGYQINIPNSDPSGSAGITVAVGKFDTSGKGSVVIGAPGANNRAGIVYIAYGATPKQAQIFYTGKTFSIPDPANSVDITGQSTGNITVGSALGSALAVSHHQNGSADTLTGSKVLDDLIIGAPNYQELAQNSWQDTSQLPGDGVGQAFPAQSYVSAGAAYVFSAGSSNVISKTPYLTYLGSTQPDPVNQTATNSKLGSALAVGDFNGLGRQDLAISAIGADASNGQVYILSGENLVTSSTSQQIDNVSNLTITGGVENSQTGTVLSSVSDITNQNPNINDLVIGSPQAADSTGTSYVIFNPNLNQVGSQLNLGDTSNDGSNVLYLNGGAPYDLSGSAIGSIVQKEQGVYQNNLLVTSPGAQQVSDVFGHPWLNVVGSIDLADISANNGYVIAGTSNPNPNLYQLVIENGALVLVNAIDGTIIWSSGTTNGVEAIMQTDGNLVVYKKHQTVVENPADVVWASGTAGNPGAYLAIDAKGDLEILSSNGSLLKQIFGGYDVNLVNSAAKPTIVAQGATLLSPYSLILGTNGILRLQNTSTGNVVWTSPNAPSTGNFIAGMQSDGSFAIINNDNGDIVWSTDVNYQIGRANNYLSLDPNGNLAVLSFDGLVLENLNGEYQQGAAGFTLAQGQALSVSNPTLPYSTATNPYELLILNGKLSLVNTTTNQIVWSSNNTVAGDRATMKPDGNLELSAGYLGYVVWSSNTNKAGSVLALDDQGNLEILRPGGFVSKQLNGTYNPNNPVSELLPYQFITNLSDNTVVTNVSKLYTPVSGLSSPIDNLVFTPPTFPLIGNGYDVASLGDITGNGYSAVASAGGNGVLIAFGNSTEALLDSADSSHSLLVTIQNVSIKQVVALGDVNGDGLNDFGIWGNDGNFYAVFGNPNLANQVSLVLNPNNKSSSYQVIHNINSITSGIGDYNGAGYDNVILNSILYLGSSTGLTPSKVPIPSGSSITGSDLNGDGYDDIVVGNPTANNNNGSIAVENGNSGMSTTINAPITNVSAPLNSWSVYTNASNPSLSNQYTVDPPAFATYNGWLYMAYTAFNGDTYIEKSKDGYNWQGLTNLGSNFHSFLGPSLAVFNGTLYLGFTGPGSGIYLAYATADSSNSLGLSFSSPYQLPSMTSGYNTTLVTYDGQLYDFFRDDNFNVSYVSSSAPSSSSSWSNSTSIGQLATYGVGAAVLPGTNGNPDTLAVSFSAKNDTKTILVSTTTSSNPARGDWKNNTVTGQTASGVTSLTNVGSTLYLGYQGTSSLNNSNINITTSSDGNIWTTPTQIANQSTGNGPGLGFFNEGLLVGYTSSNRNPAIEIATSNPIYDYLQMGAEVVGIGDFNGDGIEDVAVLAPGAVPVLGLGSTDNSPNVNNSGEVFIYYGSSNGISPNAQPDIVFGLPVSNTYQNIQLDNIAVAGDINGSGCDGLLISASSAALKTNSLLNNIYPNTGLVFAVFGSTTSWSSGQYSPTNPFNLSLLTANQSSTDSSKPRYNENGFSIYGIPGSQAGISLSGGTDFNGDGLGDLVIGAPGNGLNNTYVVYSSDFNSTINQVGTIADDVMQGTPTAETFIGDLGNDQIYTDGGRDVVYGGPGDDLITVSDTYFQRLDGGTGTNVLKFEGYNTEAWDLTTLSPGDRLKNFAILDITGYGANFFTLNSKTVDLLSSNDTIQILMDLNDTLNLSSDFSYQGTVYQNQQLYYKYASSSSAATVLVDIANVSAAVLPSNLLPVTFNASLINIPSPILPSNQVNKTSYTDNNSSGSVSDTNPVTSKLSISNPVVSKVNGLVELTIERRGDLSQPLTVDYYTEDSTGLAGIDYFPVAGQLVFAAGINSTTVDVKLPPDLIYTGDKQFKVIATITQPNNTTLQSWQVQLTSINSSVIRNFSQTTLTTPLPNDPINPLTSPVGEQDFYITANKQGYASLSFNVTGDPNVNGIYVLNAQGNWINFVYNGSTGAQITHNGDGSSTVNLTFQDGGRGDADKSNNGVIQVKMAVTDSPLTPVVGTPLKDTLTGNQLIGLGGGDSLTGSAVGANEFYYTGLNDTGSIITNFKAGTDRINLTEVLNSIGYKGKDPILDHVVGFKHIASGTFVTIDTDGLGIKDTAHNFAFAKGLTETQLSNPNNFVF